MWRDNNEQRAPLINNKGEPNTESGQYGKKYEYEAGFKGVKEEGRTCNDVFFAALFMLVISAMISISLVGFTKGNPTTLVQVEEFEYLNGTDVYANGTGFYFNGTKIPGSDDVIIEAEAKAEYWFQDAVAIMKRDVDVLGGALAFAFILAVGWIQLMRYFTKLFIYLTLILGIGGIIAAGVFFLHTGIKNESSSFKYSSYGIFAVAGILIILVFILRKKIALTSALFAECCKGFQHNPSILFVGVLVFVMLSAFTIYWITQFIYLYSVPEGGIQIPQTPWQFNTKIRNLLWFQLFAYFWVAAFLSAVFQVSIAGGMATWYFSRDINAFGASQGSPTLRSFGRAFTKSFGSLALGSLLLAAVQFLNFILRMAKKTQWKNPVARCIFGCLQCIVGCVLRLVQFVDRFTYIYIAMHGQNFCSSARGVFNLIERNAFSAIVVDVLGEIILFIGKLVGTAATTMFTVGIINHFGRPISPVTVTVAAVVSFRIFSLFAKIVHVGVDTVMVCYMEDLERNKDGALYMSTELHNMLQDKVQEKAGERRVNA